MSAEGKDAIVRITKTSKIREVTEADHKFIIAACMVISYAIMLAIPILAGNKEILQLVAATMGGPVGTVIGYYFGTKKT